jgi:hypothetical protein
MIAWIIAFFSSIGSFVSVIFDFLLRNFKIVVVLLFLGTFLMIWAYFLGFVNGLLSYVLNLFCYIGVSGWSIDLVASWGSWFILFFFAWKISKLILSQ